MRRRILNTMKRLEIVLEREQLPAVQRVLAEHATGYTVLPEVTGFGHHGEHEDDIVLVMAVVTRDHIDPILDQLLPLLHTCSGNVLLSDVQVMRGEYFVPEVRDKIGIGRLH
jgi:nitrogen regulatory protein PII